MPKKAGEFLIGLAKKSGLDLTPEQQEHINKIDVELSDEFISPIDKSLISLKDAMNNHSDIRNHYHAQVYDKFDNNLKDLMDELELGDNERNAILTERNTNKRIPALIKLVKGLEQQKATANLPDKAAINKQMEDLNAQIRLEKENYNKAVAEFEKQRKEDRINSKKDKLFSNYKTIYDDLDPEIREMNLRNLLDKNLQDNNATLSFDDNGNFVLVKKDGTNFFDGDKNQQEFPATFVEKVLSRNKILKTTQVQTSQSAAGDTNNGQQGNPAGGSANSNQNASNHQAKIVKSMNAEAIRDLTKNAQNPVFGGGVA